MKSINRVAVLIVAGLLNFTLPSSAQDKPMKSSTNHTETAVFGGGCYWCTEAIFQMLPGVKSVASGFAGGTKENPTYEEVCTGTTGHAEVIQIEYDPSVISYEKLLHTFWQAHDPTTLNRQGPDYGSQYRSVVFYADQNQQKAAQAYIAQLTESHAYSEPIVTQVVPLTHFYPAEGYHQNYCALHPDNPYIMINDLPKLKRFQGEYPTLYQP